VASVAVAVRLVLEITVRVIPFQQFEESPSRKSSISIRLLIPLEVSDGRRVRAVPIRDDATDNWGKRNNSEDFTAGDFRTSRAARFVKQFLSRSEKGSLAIRFAAIQNTNDHDLRGIGPLNLAHLVESQSPHRLGMSDRAIVP